MFKKKSAVIAVCVMLMVLMLTLTGCGGSKLSGTYVNPDDNSTYVVFDGSTATFYEGGSQTRSGSFEVSGKTSGGQYMLTVTYESESLSTECYYLNESRDTIYFTIVRDNGAHGVGDVAFIKE